MGPDPAVAQVRRAVRELLAAACPPGSAVLVACSGGADSLALAAATAFEAPRAGVRAGLITVDHGLQDGSAAQAARAAAIGYELGLDPIETVTVAVAALGGPEAAARAARYAALDATARALGARILLGHTLDDQAETVLLGLGRGSGPRSIAGMRPVTARYLRPLLGVRRATTRAACAALGLPAWEDPHNDDTRYQRVRLRHEVLPLLDDVLQGGVAEALARTAALVQDDLDALDALAAQYLDQSRVVVADRPQPDFDQGWELDVVTLGECSRAVRTRVLRAWARGAGAGPLSAEHTDVLNALVTRWHGQGPVHLPGGLRVVRRSGKLVAQPAPDPNGSNA